MSEINDWDILAANNNDTPPDGWPENTMAYSEVNNTGREGMSVLARYFQDLNGSLSTGGVADAYTLTLNAAYSAYFAGMYFAAQFNATNTGPTTIDVNGIGVQNITDRGGNPLSASELVSGGIYELRYDGSQFQLMGSIVGAAVVSEAIFTNSNAPDLVDTDVALNVGAADPDAAQHIEIGPQQIQSKSDISTAADIFINALGGTVILHSSGARVAHTIDRGMMLRDQSNADPTVPDNINAELQIESLDGNLYAEVGFSVGTILRMANRAHGGLIQINGEDTGGSAVNMAQFDPDGAATLYFANAAVLATTVTGAEITGDTGNNVVVTALAPATQAARYVLRADAGGMRINVDNAGLGSLNQTNAAGNVEDIWIDFNRNAAVALRYNNTARLETTNLGATVFGSIFDVDNDGSTGVSTMRVRNSAGGIAIQAENVSGDPEIFQTSSAGVIEDTLMAWTRNGGRQDYVNNVETFKLLTAACRIQSNGNTSTESCLLYLSQQNDITRLLIGFNASDTAIFENNIEDAEVSIRANDGGVIRPYLTIDPQGNTATFFFNSLVRGGFRDVGVAGFGMAGIEVDASGNQRPGGMNVMPVLENDVSDSFDLLYNGRIWHKDSGGAVTYTCPNDANIPQGGTYVVANEDSEDLTIAAATGVTLRWFDGGGAAPPTGSRTLAQAGVCTVYKYTNTEYWIWGSGLS